MGKSYQAMMMALTFGSVCAFVANPAKAAQCDGETYLFWKGIGNPSICDNHQELETQLEDAQTAADQESNAPAASQTPATRNARAKSTRIMPEKQASSSVFIIPATPASTQKAIETDLQGEALSGTLQNDASAADPAPLPMAFFARAFGAFGENKSQGGRPSSDSQSVGIVMGLDVYRNDWLRVALVGMYGLVHVDVNKEQTEIDVQLPKLGTQLTAEWGNWRFDSITLYGPEITKTSRIANDFGLLVPMSNEYTNHRLTQAFEVAHSHNWQGTIIQPYAGVELDWYHQARAVEKGSTNVAIHIKSASNWSGQTKLGLMLAREMAVGETIITPKLGAAWLHRFGNLSNSQKWSFDQGFSYQNVGKAPLRDALAIEAGLSLQLRKSLSAQMGYSGTLSGFETSHAGSFGLKINF